MTIHEADNFYEYDKKKYNLKINKDFLSYLENLKREGYYQNFSLEDMQDYIEKNKIWYEFKYPETEFYEEEGIGHFYPEVKQISEYMDYNQYLNRLNEDQLHFIDGRYRSKGWSTCLVKKEDGTREYETTMTITLYDKREDDRFEFLKAKMPLFIYADYISGRVKKSLDLDFIKDPKILTVETLLSEIENNYTDIVEYDELKQLVFDHECDLKVREKLIELAALRLLYSKDTIPERGYERAKRCISEMNEALKIHISDHEINRLINKNYSYDKNIRLVEDPINDEIKETTKPKILSRILDAYYDRVITKTSKKLDNNRK